MVQEYNHKTVNFKARESWQKLQHFKVLIQNRVKYTYKSEAVLRRNRKGVVLYMGFILFVKSIFVEFVIC